MRQLSDSYRAPDYILTDAFERQEDESWRLVSSSGTVYQVPKYCPGISYGMNELSSFLIISIKLSYQSLISFRVASSPPNWLTTFRFTSSISICIALNISSTCHIYRIYSATLLFLFSRAINILIYDLRFMIYD